MSILQDLYHSEINFSVSTFWDGGFDVKLGDAANGFKAEANFDRWGMVEPWLRDQAIEHFPSSLFAKLYRDRWRPTEPFPPRHPRSEGRGN